MSKSEDRTMIKVAILYYKEGLTQAQIAKKIGVSRSLVSKMLIDARNNGFIEFFINSEEVYSLDLEIKLEKMLSLDSAVVIDTSNLSYPEIEKVVGQTAAIYLKDKIAEAKNIGISWGKSIKSLVTQFPFEQLTDVTFIPLIGGMGTDHFDIHSNQLCYEFARKTRGEAKYLYAPAVVSNETIRKEFESNAYIKQILTEAKDVSLAIVSISSPSHFNTMEKIGYVDSVEMERLSDLGVVGDMNSRFFDKNGSEVPFSMNQNVIGVDLQTIKEIPQVVAIAYDEDKWSGIYYAGKNQLITSLITTDVIAKKILSTTFE